MFPPHILSLFQNLYQHRPDHWAGRGEGGGGGGRHTKTTSLVNLDVSFQTLQKKKKDSLMLAVNKCNYF